MTEGQLNADVAQYLQAAAANVPPPPITSDPLVTGTTPIEQLLRVLGLAANLGDPADQAESIEEHARREAQMLAAAEEFANQDEQASSDLSTLAGPDPTTQMANQLPQLASGTAGALAGAVGGALQPLAQIPQQIAQGAQQALQATMGLFAQTGGTAPLSADDAALAAIPLEDDFDSAGTDLGDTGDLSGWVDGGGLGEDLGAGMGTGAGGFGAGSGGGIGAGLTAPMPMLGPPATPSASTAPSSAPTFAPPTPPPTPVTAAGPTGMAGMPMVPPAAMQGAAGPDKDAKTDTKRVAAPTVRNGAPVQGRLTVPPVVPVVTSQGEAQPVVTKRVVLPHSRNTEAE